MRPVGDAAGAVATGPDASAAARGCRSGAAILEATIEAIAEHGIEGLTIDDVAGRARVGKATIYRHWRSRAELVVDAIACSSPRVPVAASGDVHADLCAAFSPLARALADPRQAALLASLLDAARRDPELAALHARHGANRREAARAVVAAAVARGDLPAATDVEHVLDLVAGPLFYRGLVVRRPMTEHEVAAVVATVLAGVGAAHAS